MWIERKLTKMAAHNDRFGVMVAVIPLFPKISYLIACKPIKNATFAAENIFKESNHAKQK